MSQPAETLHSPNIRPEDRNEDSRVENNNNDHDSSNQNTEVKPQSPSQKRRRSATPTGFTPHSQTPEPILAAQNALYRVGKPASKRSRGMSVSTVRGRGPHSPVGRFNMNNDFEEEYLANRLAGTPRNNLRRRLQDRTGRRSILTDSRKRRGLTRQPGNSESRGRAPETDASSPVSGKKVSRRSSGTIADRRVSKKYDSFSRATKPGVSGQPVGTETDKGTRSGSGSAQTDTDPVDSNINHDSARTHLTLPRAPEAKVSIQLGDSSPIDNSPASSISSWAIPLGTPNTVFGDQFRGSFSAPFGSPLPTPNHDPFRDSDDEHKELGTGGKVARTAFEEVEKKNRELEQELSLLKKDHAKTQELLEKEEAEHRITRAALEDFREEKEKADQEVLLAATKHIENLQAAGKLAKDDAKPVYQVNSEGQQSGHLYRDHRNQRIEENARVLLLRAQAKFIMMDYEDMAKFAFDALAEAEKLLFEPLNARCHFNIGIAYWYTHRFGEAQHHFELAQGVEGKYGISMRCVYDWLGRCEVSLSGSSSAHDQPPTRNERDVERYSDTKFSAEEFYAPPTKITHSQGVMDDERTEEGECIVGQKESPLQRNDDGDNKAEYFSDTAPDSPRVLSLEDELALSDETDDQWSDGENDEDFQDFEEATSENSKDENDDSEEADEIPTPKAKNFPVADGSARSRSNAYNKLGKAPRPKPDSYKKQARAPKSSTDPSKLAPSKTSQPNGLADRMAKLRFTPAQDDPKATVVPSASKAKSSKTANPQFPKSSRAPLKDMTAQKRDRAVTYSNLSKLAQKYTDPANPRKLPAPLSTLKEVTDIPVKDMEAFANRSRDVRIEEAAKGQSSKTATKAFVLYRSAYAARAEAFTKSKDLRVKSAVASESWGMEPPRVRERFEKWARLENENQGKAFSGDK